MSGRTGAKTGQAAKVHEYLVKRSKQVVFMNDMTQELALLPNQVSSAMSYLRQQKGLTIEIITSGHSYRYVPDVEKPKPPVEEPKPKPPSVRVFEELTVAKNGELILRGSDGTVWRASEI
jgi:hypothetical protein